MPILQQKVFAYITHGQRLLLFRQPNAPEAGIQAPAGTHKLGEQPAAGVLREAYEETGLPHLTVVQLLGEQIRDMTDFKRDEIHHRYFYHLQCMADPPITWRHAEPDPPDGTEEPIVFEFFWAELPDQAPELIADHGKFVPELLKRLHNPGQ
jgi:ADP-ribose pyrophosphatase YjhB (NUDIX family)